jgi:hypothetical protein
MATIRPQQLAPVNYGDSNALLQAAQQMISRGVGGITGAFDQYRQNVVDRNTANAVNLLTGAQNTDDLQARQGAVTSILQNANGDIDNTAVQRAQQTIPDVLLQRQGTQNQLAQFTQQQHDQPLINQAMALFQSGDTTGAQQALSGVQGDASRAIAFGAGRQDAAASQALQRQQLGIQQAGLALRQQSAKDRAAQATKNATQLQNFIKQLTGANADAITESGAAATKVQNQRLSDAEKDNPLNNPGSDSSAAAAKITADNRSWLTAPLPNSWRSDRGGRLSSMIDQLDPNKTLTDKQRTNLLTGMNNVYDASNLTDDPDKAALDWGKDALDRLNKTQGKQLENTQAQINQKRTTRINQMQVLLSSMLGGNGQLDPMALQLLNQNDDNEE